VPGERATPWRPTCEWSPWQAAMKQASRRRSQTPLSSSLLPGFRDFTATTWPEARWRALATTPKPPSPSRQTSSYQQALPMRRFRRPVLGLPSAAVAGDVVDHGVDGGSAPGADGCPHVATMLLDHVADGREPGADGARLPCGDKFGAGAFDFFRGGCGLSGCKRNGVHVGSRCWRTGACVFGVDGCFISREIHPCCRLQLHTVRSRKTVSDMVLISALFANFFFILEMHVLRTPTRC
jgi:hypothetical protein